MGMICRGLTFTADFTKGEVHMVMVTFSSLEHETEEGGTGAQLGGNTHQAIKTRPPVLYQT